MARYPHFGKLHGILDSYGIANSLKSIPARTPAPLPIVSRIM
jgi:hypothetical protein